MPRFDRRDMCWFWTTDNWAMGYCRFDHEDCHASRATFDINGLPRCKKYIALVKTSIRFNAPLEALMFYPEGKNVYPRVIPKFVTIENERWYYD